MADAHAATSIGARFEILADDLPQRCDLLVDGGRASSSGRRAVTQCSKLVSCSMTVGIAVAFFVGITPVEIEPGLDARREKQRAAGLATHLVLGPTQQLRDARDDLATCMAQQIDRVLDKPGPASI